MAIWPSAVATDADLYIAKNALQTTLATALGTGDVSVVLASATGFPVAGAVVIGNEVIFYTNISGATLTGCTRGADGTTAAAHSVGVPVGAAIVAFHHNGLKDEIKAIESWADTHIGKGTTVTSTEFGYLSGVTSAIQTQMDLKAPKASPTFTGTVTIPTPFTLGAVSVTATGTEMNYLVGVSSDIQTQLGLKAPAANPTFTGVAQFASGTSSAPSIAFSAEPGLGLYRTGAAGIGFAFGTVLGASMDFTTGYFDMRGNLLLNLSLGSNSAPSLTFQSDLDTGMYHSAANTMNWTTNGTARMSLDTTSLTINLPLYLGSGTVSVPTHTFSSDPDTGIYQVDGAGSNTVGITGGGTLLARFGGGNNQSAGHWIPSANNTYSTGISAAKWTEVWAVNGTIQTSMLATKTNVEYMEPEDCKIPKAIYFNRPTDDHDHQQLGFEADILPEEAHPIINSETGERSHDDVYTSSVIAMLCQAARNDYARLAEQDTKIANLEARLLALESK